MTNFITGAYSAPGILLTTGAELWSTAIEYCIYAAIIALSIFALILLRKRSRLPGHDEYRKQLKRLAEGISRLNDGEGKGKFFKRAAYAAYRADALAFTAAAIAEKGVRECFITLHVGLGTFRPVQEDEITDHKMHSEYFCVTEQAAAALNRAKAEGRRVIAVGTTSVRTLESAAGDDGIVRAQSGNTQIFIYPPYKFKCVDALITNFHLPESTLIMLVAALTGREKILKIYKEAVEERYRFFSFGDAMMIV